MAMKIVRTESENDLWPKRAIVGVTSAVNQFNAEDYAYQIKLSCGHGCVVTSDVEKPDSALAIGTDMGCFPCFISEPRPH